MIALRLNTTYLDLPEGIALDLNIFNPLFDRDGAEALFSIPFTLPATPTNLHALAHANRLDNADNTTTYLNAALEIEGLPFEPAGVLELDGQTFTANSITATFKNIVPTLFEQLDKLKINDLLETIAVPNITDAYWIFPLSVPPSSAGITYTIIIDTLGYSFTTPSSVPNAAVTQSLALAINAAHPGLADTGFNDELILNSLLVNDVAIDVPNLVNLDDPTATTVGQAALADIEAFINSISFTPDDRVSFPYLYWEKFYKGLVEGFTERHNVWLDGDTLSNEPADNDKEWKTGYIPLVRVPYILEQIALAIPDYFTVHTGFFAADDGAQLVVLNNRTLDRVYYDRYPNNGTGVFKYLNGHKGSIALNEHVPNMSAGEFFRRMMEQFALYMEVIGTSVKFIKRRDMITSSPLDWTSLSEPDYSATRKHRQGFTLQFPDLKVEDKKFLQSAGEPYILQATEYLSGEGFQEFTLPAGITKWNDTVIALPIAGTILKCPYINQPGSSDEGGLGDNDYSFRLLFDRGIQLTDASDNYVMATPDNLDQAGDTIADLSMDLEAADGLYHLHHKGILELLADGQPVTMAMRLSIADILNTRKWDNARRTITLPDGQVTAVIKSIKFKVDANGLGLSLVELVQEK
jgi:hypothetical protein